MKTKYINILLILGWMLLDSYSRAEPYPASNPSNINLQSALAHETFVLNNGLKVILHVDDSNPIVAISTVVHVGSSRERPGRTGFAHFFEHVAFNDSENVPKGSNRKLIPELGGYRNGYTWRDGTIYYEVVPVDAFDKLLWIDSDRFGFMINTVTQNTLEEEKGAVLNEKRQDVDNKAYGLTESVIKKALYPTSHPYSWTTLGAFSDLNNATLEDVRSFYNQYYVPSNATLVIAGDIDVEQTKRKVKQWFGEINEGKPVKDLKPMPANLIGTIKLYHEDNFATLPELQLTFPSVQQYHPDSWALKTLAAVLTEGNDSPLYATVVKDKKLAPSVHATATFGELAGEFNIRIRAKKQTKLDDVYAAVKDALTKFENDGINAATLQRIKAKQETEFVINNASVLDKAKTLAMYSEYAASSDYAAQDLSRSQGVSAQDLMRVYVKYIKNKPYVATSFVPKKQDYLALRGSNKAEVTVEEHVESAIKELSKGGNIAFTKTPTKFDRSEPPLGVQPLTRTPAIWQHKMKGGMAVLGIEHYELPLVHFSLRVDGGQWLDNKVKLGTAELLTLMMSEGTKSLTAVELENRIGILGADLTIEANYESIVLEGTVLAKNFNALMAIVSEIVIHPRWDENTFSRVKAQRLATLQDAEANPWWVGYRVLKHQIYGVEHLSGQPLGGNKNSVGEISLSDVKEWHTNNLSADLATFHVTGAVGAEQVKRALSKLDRDWKSKPVEFPSHVPPRVVSKPKVFFVDFPNAEQSALFVGKPTTKGSSPMHDNLVIANNRLGADESSRIYQELRIKKGYTYSAYSLLSRPRYTGLFTVLTRVRSNATLDSLQTIRRLITSYANTYVEDDLLVTRNVILKKYPRQLETLPQLTKLLSDISTFGLPIDYIEKQQTLLKRISVSQLRYFFKTHINEQNMIYVIVGDAKTQFEQLKKLGYGEPILLDVTGKRL